MLTISKFQKIFSRSFSAVASQYLQLYDPILA
jgi:hypothetical protein